jgi:hypothetical protein
VHERSRLKIQYFVLGGAVGTRVLTCGIDLCVPAGLAFYLACYFNGKNRARKWVDIKKGGVSLPKVMDLLGWMSSCQPAPTEVQQLIAAIR